MWLTWTWKHICLYITWNVYTSTHIYHMYTYNKKICIWIIEYMYTYTFHNIHPYTKGWRFQVWLSMTPLKIIFIFVDYLETQRIEKWEDDTLCVSKLVLLKSKVSAKKPTEFLIQDTGWKSIYLMWLYIYSYNLFGSQQTEKKNIDQHGSQDLRFFFRCGTPFLSVDMFMATATTLKHGIQDVQSNCYTVYTLIVSNLQYLTTMYTVIFFSKHSLDIL